MSLTTYIFILTSISLINTTDAASFLINNPPGLSSTHFTKSMKPSLILLALSNDGEGRNKKVQYQQKAGFRQIGGPIQQSVARILSKDDIQTLLRSRAKARRSRDFSKADEILDTLGDAGVFVNDSEKIWRADGIFSVSENDDLGGDEDGNRYSSVGRRIGGMKSLYFKSEKSKFISQNDAEYVQKRLEERTQARLEKDYMAADTILDELRYLFHIEVDDSLKTWCVLGKEKSSFLKGDYVFGGKRIANISQEDVAAIEDLIKQRVEVKKRKDYVVADTILADLKVRYNVRVDDKKKQWHFY